MTIGLRRNTAKLIPDGAKLRGSYVQQALGFQRSGYGEL
jgi:hypothetical protein